MALNKMQKLKQDVYTYKAAVIHTISASLRASFSQSSGTSQQGNTSVTLDFFLFPGSKLARFSLIKKV